MNEKFLGTMKNLNALIPFSKNNSELLNGIANVAGQCTNSNAIFMNSNGKILAGLNNVPSEMKSEKDEDWFIDQKMYGQITKFNDIKSNVNLEGLENYTSAVIPVQNGGSLLLFKNKEEQFSEDEIVNAELCANNVALINQQQKYEQEESEKRELKVAQDVLNSLSFTEIDVVAEVFEYVKDGEGFVVASKIADKNGYARSVTVNALRKLESAGVVQTRSLGVKGTYIKVINSKLCSEIKKFTHK